MENKYPCWLTRSQLLQAEKLLEIGFCYCGQVDDFCIELNLGRFMGWQFYTAPGEITLDAVCKGALYSKCLEFDHDQTKTFLKNQIKLAKDAIASIKQESDYQQLSLF